MDRTVIEGRRGGYESFLVKGFRGIRDLRLSRLGRINLLTGLNGAGKTTILEALTAHSRPMSTGIADFDSLRGILIKDDRRPGRVPWASLFPGELVSGLIMLSGATRDGSWDVNLIANYGTAPRPDLSGIVPNGGSRSLVGTLRIEYIRDSEMRSRELRHYSDGTTESGFIAVEDPQQFLRIVNGSPLNQATLAAMFSALQQDGSDLAVVELLQRIEPRLKRLLIWTDGQNSALHGDLGIGATLPLPLISDGFNRIAGAALAAANSANGAVAIDEIENGVHVSVLGEFWRGLHSVSERFNTQIFATTHSRECTEAALRSVPGDDLLLHRIVRDNDGVRSQEYDPDMISTALESGLAFR